MKIYLAGPDVFFREAIVIGQSKRAICKRHGFQGLYPLDNEADAVPRAGRARAIFNGNVAMIREADVLVANLTPFRGVSADPGTAVEVGLAFALGKSVFGYSNSGFSLVDRAARGERPVAEVDGRLFSSDGMAIEDFDLADNLMLIEAIRTSGGDFVSPPDGETRPHDDLTQFEKCVALIADADKVQP